VDHPVCLPLLFGPGGQNGSMMRKLTKSERKALEAYLAQYSEARKKAK
jgi:hypothetical protein